MKIVCVCFLAILATAYGKTFNKCSLTAELLGVGVSSNEVHHWVCMAAKESSMNTRAVNTNSGGSSDHGIFQINDYWNCDPQNGRRTRNGCNKPCSAFKNDQLADDVTCVRRIMAWNGGFAGASYGYRDYCHGAELLKYKC